MFLNKATIPFFVFITGACVLVIEVVAMRILAPYYGNTIYTVSAVISVVLAALSCGYYIGGKLADKKPQEKLFYLIVGLSGIVIIGAYLLGSLFLEAVGYRLSIIEGPIIASLFLFFPQNFLLGMVSPFAVKLHTVRLQNIGVGSASGQIFFWSTIGSICGSLLAGFYLIPTFGISQIMLGVGFLLAILGFFSILPIKRIVLKVGLIALLVAISFYSIHAMVVYAESLYPANVVYHKDAVYQRLMIYDGLYEGHSTRFLFQDRNASAAAFLDSNQLPYEYTKYYALYQLFPVQVKRSLVIGGGAYSIPSALIKELPEAQVDVAEIEPSLFDVIKQYFPIENSQRMHNMVEDGRRLLHEAPDATYDVIFSDAYSSLYSSPDHLTTQEFFRLVKEKLSDKGVFIANVIGSLPAQAGLQDKPESVLFSEMRTFNSIFDNAYFFAVTSADSNKIQNFIFVGYKGSEVIDLQSRGVKENENPIFKELATKQVNPANFNLAKYQLLTDNYSPIEYLISKEFPSLGR